MDPRGKFNPYYVEDVLPGADIELIDTDNN